MGVPTELGLASAQFAGSDVAIRNNKRLVPLLKRQTETTPTATGMRCSTKGLLGLTGQCPKNLLDSKKTIVNFSSVGCSQGCFYGLHSLFVHKC